MMGLLTCMCRLTRVMSSCDDMADMKLLEERDGVPDEEPCDSACLGFEEWRNVRSNQ